MFGLSRRWILFGSVLLLGLIELIWIVAAGRPGTRSATSVNQSATSVAGRGAVTTVVAPVAPVAPRLVRLGVLAFSETPGSLDVGLSRAIAARKATRRDVSREIEVVRCVVVEPQTSAICAEKFRETMVSAVVANPDVDPTPLLQIWGASGIPYIGVYPTHQEEFTNPASVQLGPGERGVTVAPLSWAKESRAPFVVYVSTPNTVAHRKVFLAQAAKAGIPVKAFTFGQVGTDVARLLSPVKARKPVLVFDTEAGGCPVIVSGLNRRKPALARLVDATFLPAECTPDAKATDLDGLRTLTVRPFPAEYAATAGSIAESVGQATLDALNDTLPDVAWVPGASLRQPIDAASVPSPQGRLGAWNCSARPDPGLPSVCGQQVFVEGLGPDTGSVRVWIDALDP